MTEVGDGPSDVGSNRRPSPEIIRAEDVTSSTEVRPYHQAKDHRITTLAIWVIGLAAGVSALSLFASLLADLWLPSCLAADAVCENRRNPEWPAEMLRLSLVASLAFVMGGNGKP